MELGGWRTTEKGAPSQGRRPHPLTVLYDDLSTFEDRFRGEAGIFLKAW
jgi:hypothetical protein